ncbi:hypothetical protein C8J56DRAFT_366855 [Mycena floridula]|nr:hypothetical protein C8J56DRAFT_366855 [Mycena floridula]
MPKHNRPAFHIRNADDDAPPEYSRNDPMSQDLDYSQYHSTGNQGGLSSAACVTQDGRISVIFDTKTKLPELPQNYAPDVKEFAVDEEEWHNFPRMNIVIMIVGSRGDVQPYVALGRRLLRDGHRIRLATHETFRTFVGEAGLEFFAIGGDPAELMSYMVKNPGLMPGMASLTNGDIPRKRKMLTEMINGCWLSCQSPCPITGRKFSADAIISNPPAFAHVHIAEALGIPLQLTFTMPWSPTTVFPHPLVNVKQSNAENGVTNYLSYAMTEMLQWQGIGDLINKFRTKTLGLKALNMRSGPGRADELKIPWTYCMSPALVPKPKDWKNHIDVVGFYFLDLASNYKPPDDLAAFLDSGTTPIYIGFGSVVVDNPEAMTKMIFEATERAGVRALVSAGWGGLGGTEIPPHVFILGNIPHDWLFADGRVLAVVHHGGAGTTSAGLTKGLPTVVVPFFGDQGFWGSMIHKAGAGPPPIPHKKLTVAKLAQAIEFVISEHAKDGARRLGEQIAAENGIEKGVESFYKHLPLKNMRCDIDPSRVAVWWSTEHCLKLSAFVAQALADAGELDMRSLEPHRTKQYGVKKSATIGNATTVFWNATRGTFSEIVRSPGKSIVRTGVAIPDGVVKVVNGLNYGFHNVPRLYGTKVRKPGEITGIGSGLKEAGKDFMYGYYDGFKGLVAEPMRGAKEEGAVGAIKGSARGLFNVVYLPAASLVAMAAYPIDGAWKTVRSAVGLERQQRKSRISDGLEQLKKSHPVQRSETLRKFESLKPEASQRRKRYTFMAENSIADSSLHYSYDSTSTILEEEPQDVQGHDLNSPEGYSRWHETMYEEDCNSASGFQQSPNPMCWEESSPASSHHYPGYQQANHYSHEASGSRRADTLPNREANSRPSTIRSAYSLPLGLESPIRRSFPEPDSRYHFDEPLFSDSDEPPFLQQQARTSSSIRSSTSDSQFEDDLRRGKPMSMVEQSGFDEREIQRAKQMSMSMSDSLPDRPQDKESPRSEVSVLEELEYV